MAEQVLRGALPSMTTRTFLRWGSGWRGQLGMGPAVTHALPAAAAAAPAGSLPTTTSRVVCGPAHALALPQVAQGA